MSIYILFEPLKIKEQEFTDVPLLSIGKFIMYELEDAGLKTMMSGSKALRYSDKFVVDEIDFMDNAKEYISNIQARNGIYAKNTINLKGNVVYTREDSLTFESDTLKYNTKNSIAQTQDNFIAYRNTDSMRGTSFIYDSINKTMKSKNVTVKYQLQESKI